MDINISVCGQAYEEFGLRVVREKEVTHVKVNPDTGAQMCVGGPGLLDLLGAKRAMVKPALQICVANGKLGEVMAAFFPTISGKTP